VITPAQGEEALQILKERCGKWTLVQLVDGQVLRVFDIAWGRDIAADYRHLTTNVSPRPPAGSPHTIDSIHTSDIIALSDEETGELLFTDATPTA
jgi:hypothetical protein